MTHRSLGVMLSANPVTPSGFLTAVNGSMDGWTSWSDQDSALKVSPLFYTLTVLTDYGLFLRHVCVFMYSCCEEIKSVSTLWSKNKVPIMQTENFSVMTTRGLNSSSAFQEINIIACKLL